MPMFWAMLVTAFWMTPKAMMRTHSLRSSARMAAIPPPTVNWRARKKAAAMANLARAIVMGGTSSRATVIRGKARAQMRMVAITMVKLLG